MTKSTPTKSILLIFFLFSLLIDCSFEKETKSFDENSPLFTKISSNQSNVKFTNKSIESPERNLGHYDYFYNGGGVGIHDLNNDGLADLFFAGNDSANKLYINKGNFNFEDISKKAGIENGKWSTGVNFVDINEDGLMDIYVCNSGPYVQDEMLSNELYINNGDQTFTESAKKYGIADTSYSSQSVFFDMDKDGDLDLFVMNHSLIGYEKSIHKWEEVFNKKDAKIQRKSSSTLYRNNGHGKFVDITKKAGVFKAGFGLGVSVSDFDENGFLDIYVANDYFIPDFMFFNQGDGTFVERIETKVSHSSFYSMGCDAADINNDGLVDLVVADMTPSDHYRGKTLMESMDTEKFDFLVNRKNYIPQYMFNTLNLNRSKGNFSEIAHFAGIAQTDWSWATLLMDLDNDSWKDLLITNGFKRDTKDRDWITELNERYKTEGVSGKVVFDQLQKSKSTPISNYLFKNSGKLKFSNSSNKWGFTEPSFSQGAAYGDLDNDGDLDIVVNNLDSEAFIYENNSSNNKNNHFIQVSLSDHGNSGKALFSKIKIFAGDQFQLLEYSFVRGYLSTMQPLAHFGLGLKNSVDKIEIEWPDGSVSTIENPSIDKRHHFDKKDHKSFFRTQEDAQFSFMDIASKIGLKDYRHNENKFDDFLTEVLLPHKQSTLGPAIAVGDVNGDGLDDFYIGGAKEQSGQLYVQNLKKGFIKNSLSKFESDAKYEDLGAEFFDADGDGDLDLYVASGGGGDINNSSALLQDRLYTNLGNGNFIKLENALPKMFSSTASISTNDWDNDGDIDLFVGGRNTPEKYPTPPISYLLENIDGVFKDVTMALSPELRTKGMITDSSWSDINNDGHKDLIVVGEWMPISMFLHTPNGFVLNKENMNLSENIGWWYSINKGDFDNDGDEDFIVGNLGLNNKFNATKEKPLQIFANDFDKNGTLDIVLGKLYKGNLAPIRGKECSASQMPFIKEKYPKFSSFASSTLGEIYGENNLIEALNYKATNFANVYLENLGDATFKLIELPPEAQLAPIMDAVVWDFENDGNLDIVIGGNMFNTEVETPSYDAGKGLYLKGTGNGTFVVYPKIEDSGIFLAQNLKQMKFLKIFKEKRPAILVANNNSTLNLLAWTR